MNIYIKNLLENKNIQWPVLVCSLCVTIIVTYLSYFQNKQQSLINFNNQIYKIERSLSTSLLAYEQILLGAVGLINTTENINEFRWNQYISITNKYVKNNYPGIKGIGLIKKVNKKDLRKYLNTIEKKNTDIIYQNKEYYYIVGYLSPLSTENKKIIGTDLSSESNRNLAMKIAEYSAESTITNKVKLLTGEEGFLMFMPIYKQKSITYEEKKANLDGFVFAPFISNIFIKKSLEQLNLNIGVNIYEGMNSSHDKLIYTSNKNFFIDKNSESYIKKNYIYYGKQFTMLYYPIDKSYNTFNYNWMVILIIGIITSLLSFYLVCSLVSTNYNANKIAIEMTQELRKNKENLEKLAHYDSLTGLANRFFFTQSLSHAINLALRNNYKIALLFIDLDSFKEVNDNFGHEAGDAVLKEVSIRIEHCLREVDLVGRLGGDEFVILIENIENEEKIKNLKKVANNIIKYINKPIIYNDNIITVGVSIGIALAPDDGKDINTLIKNADKAMYNTKQSGKNNYSMCTENDTK